MSLPTYRGTTIPVVPFAVDWETSPKWSQTYSTTITECLDTSEERQARLPRPLYGLVFRTLSLSASEQAYLQNLMQTAANLPFACPLWPMQCALTAAASAGATSLTVDSTTDCLFEVFYQYAILWESFESWEIVELSAVGTNTMTLAAAITGTYSTSAFLVPVAYGLVPREPMTQITDENGQWDCKFQETFNRLTDQSVPEADTDVVSAPSGLTATAVSSTSIDLSWSESSSVDYFAIERDSGSGFTEIATVTSPTTTYADTGLTALETYTYRVRAHSSAGYSSYSTEASATTSSTWAPRVVANGGASPSTATQTAVNTFLAGLKTDGLDTLFKALCVFVPDSVIAATTPLIVGSGSDPWVNNGFLAADLSADGFLGDGASKYLDTGVPRSAQSGADGLSVVVTASNSASVSVEVGHRDSAGVSYYLLQVGGGGSGGGKTFFSTAGVSGNGTANYWDAGFTGFVSGNTSATATAVYAASPEESIAQQASSTAYNSTILTTQTLYAFALNDGGTANAFSGRRVAMVAIHDAFTLAQATTFWGRLQTLLVALGGNAGSRVENWSRKVQAAGGSAPSSTTKTALKAFYSALDTAGIARKFSSLNCLVPDNLIAALVPLICTEGSEVWTNHNFVSGDLSVTGLTGNASDKYLDTGCISSGSSIVSPASAGMSVVWSGGTATAVNYALGAAGSAAYSQFGIARTTTPSINFSCWQSGGGDAADHFNWASGSGISNSWRGFTSMNRTSTSAFTAYAASSSLSFTSVGSGSGTMTGSTTGTYPVFAFALNSLGSPSTYSNHTFSFIAIHAGFTSAQAQALYNAVAAMRSSLGGGNP
jgi:Fibronectin type III domain